MKKRFLSLALALVLSLSLSVPAAAAGGFTDVDADAYYAQAVNWAVDQKITSGTTPTTFSPNQTCTRAQIITFLWRAAGSPNYGPNREIRDVSSSDYYYKAVVWAAEFNLFDGNTFRPNDPCTRLMAMEFMWRGSDSTEVEGSDFSDCSSMAVKWAVARGITTGTSATTFSPNQTCTRSEIVTFLHRQYSVDPYGTFLRGDGCHAVISQNGSSTQIYLYEEDLSAPHDLLVPVIAKSTAKDRFGVPGVIVNAPGTKVNLCIFADYITVSITSSDPDLASFSGKYLRQ